MSKRTMFAAGTGVAALGVAVVFAVAPATAEPAGRPVAAAVAPTTTAAPSTVGSTAAPAPGGAADRSERIARQEGRALRKACHRLERVDRRTDRWLARVNGGADVPGSVAALKARAAAAAKAGDAERAATLTERAERRAANAAEMAELGDAAAKAHAEHC